MNPDTILKQVQFPEKVKGIFAPSPYKVLYGGRGSAKSWAIARALLILGLYRPLFILCAREIQKSIDESVYKLLSDQIVLMGLQEYYVMRDTEIVGVNGTRFVFAGLRNHTTAIKSMEGIDICWVEEGTFVSHYIWEILLPTIRKDPPGGPFEQGAEIWVSFNPELISDYTYKHWVLNPPPGTLVLEVNWRDNPWFPETLRRQKDFMRQNDYDAYLTVWEGKVRRSLAGAIYAKELATAIEEGRVGPHIRYDKSRPVDVTFDLGRADMTSIWFIQQIGMLHNAVDYYENCGYDISHYIGEMQARRYNYRNIYLPHDAEHELIAAPKSVRVQVKDAYPACQVKVVPRIASRSLRINAMRQLFPRVCFNEEKCQDGIKALQHYQYEVNVEKGRRSREPLHNWASHGADSLGTYAQELLEGRSLPVEVPLGYDVDADAGGYNHGQGWMR